MFRFFYDEVVDTLSSQNMEGLQLMKPVDMCPGGDKQTRFDTEWNHDLTTRDSTFEQEMR